MMMLTACNGKGSEVGAKDQAFAGGSERGAGEKWRFVAIRDPRFIAGKGVKRDSNSGASRLGFLRFFGVLGSFCVCGRHKKPGNGSAQEVVRQLVIIRYWDYRLTRSGDGVPFWEFVKWASGEGLRVTLAHAPDGTKLN